MSQGKRTINWDQVELLLNLYTPCCGSSFSTIDDPLGVYFVFGQIDA